jgi:hypothetical protein
LQDLNNTLKSVARGFLVSMISKKDTHRIEIEKDYILQEFKVNLIDKSIKNYFKIFSFKDNDE